MKSQKKNGKVTPDEFVKQIKRLQDEFFTADVQFELFVGLRKAGPKYKEDFQCSPLFWDYTVQAHINMVVLRLCRIYDADEKTFSLPVFLKTIEANQELFNKAAFVARNQNNPNLEQLAKYPRDLNLDDLKAAQRLCSPDNPIVKNLLILRGHFIAHTNYNVAFGDAESFQKKFPLPFRDIETLIHDGFDTVNTYSALFGSSYFPNSKSTNFPVHDYQFILEAIKTRREKLFGD